MITNFPADIILHDILFAYDNRTHKTHCFESLYKLPRNFLYQTSLLEKNSIPNQIPFALGI